MAFHGIKKIEIKFAYDATGAQGAMTKLEVDLYAAVPTIEFTEFDNTAGPDDPSNDPLLWGGEHHIDFIKGSNCIVIGGKRYCWG